MEYKEYVPDLEHGRTRYAWSTPKILREEKAARTRQSRRIQGMWVYDLHQGFNRDSASAGRPSTFNHMAHEACSVALSDVNNDLNPAVARIKYLSSWPSALLATNEGLCAHSQNPLLEALLFKNYRWENKCVIYTDTKDGPTSGSFESPISTGERFNREIECRKLFSRKILTVLSCERTTNPSGDSVFWVSTLGSTKVAVSIVGHTGKSLNWLGENVGKLVLCGAVHGIDGLILNLHQQNVSHLVHVVVWRGSGGVGAAVLQTRHTATPTISFNSPLFSTLEN
ncbi:hypothetical protein B0H10DRAFT_1966575 [Mycena sp. CBHHK59/15]|nr:hypothetical protein B0H10DRAFT_1966575 [Mycena sp. CBHHK59/15]